MGREKADLTQVPKGRQTSGNRSATSPRLLQMKVYVLSGRKNPEFRGKLTQEKIAKHCPGEWVFSWPSRPSRTKSGRLQPSERVLGGADVVAPWTPILGS